MRIEVNSEPIAGGIQTVPKKSFLPPIDNLQKFLDKALESRDELSVLEAGCGSASHFNFRQKVHLSGIDISEKQLQRNKQLQDAILGDIQYYEFQPNSYDVRFISRLVERNE